MNKTALLLTAYERVGSVGTAEYIEMYIDEMEVTADMIGDYNEYLSEQGYEQFFDDLEMMLDGFQPMDVARMTFYGDFRFAADFHRFNGYGNIDSFEEYEVVREMRNDRDFLQWYILQNDLIDFDSIDEIIEEANELIDAGY